MQFQLGRRVVKVTFINAIISVEYRSCFAAADDHHNSYRHAGAHKVACTGPAEVVDEALGPVSLSCWHRGEHVARFLLDIANADGRIAKPEVRVLE